MPDEATEAPEKTGTPTETEVTPETGALAEAQTESPDNTDWKQRYEDLRPEADRRASVLADIEGRNGPERQAQALAEHARIELEEEEAEEPEEEFDLPPDPSDEIAAIKQQLAERDEVAQAAEFDRLEAEYIESTVEDLADKANLKLNDEEYEVVVNHGLANRDSHDGKPDLEGGIAKLKAIQEAARKSYAKSKDDSVLAPVGATGEPKIDLRNKDERVDLGTKVFEAAERSKQT
jgi:hypothetical protein